MCPQFSYRFRRAPLAKHSSSNQTSKHYITNMMRLIFVMVGFVLFILSHILCQSLQVLQQKSAAVCIDHLRICSSFYFLFKQLKKVSLSILNSCGGPALCIVPCSYPICRSAELNYTSSTDTAGIILPYIDHR